LHGATVLAPFAGYSALWRHFAAATDLAGAADTACGQRSMRVKRARRGLTGERVPV